MSRAVNERRKMMNGNQNVLLILVVASSVFVAGCSGAGGSSNGNAVSTASTTGNNQSQPATATTGNAANVNASPSTPPTTNAGATATNAASTGNKSGAPSAKMPTPQIGSGANDFYLFTKLRGAIDSDSEMKNSSVIINISNGNVTLTGGVADEQQKAKAEQIARSADGVKSVKNQLRVGAGAPPSR